MNPKPCSHPHLKFKSQGAILACVDCPRMYHMLMPQIGALYGGVPDVGYSHPELSEIVGRHSPYESPRDKPLPVPKPIAKPVAPPRALPPPVKKIEPEAPTRPTSKARRLMRGKKR